MQTVSDIIRHYSRAGKGGVDMKIGALACIDNEMIKNAKFDMQEVLKRDLALKLSKEIMKMDLEIQKQNMFGGQATEFRTTVHVFTDAQLEKIIQEKIEEVYQDIIWDKRHES